MPEPPENPTWYAPQLSCRCAILCLERALESKMDSTNGHKGSRLVGLSGMILKLACCLFRCPFWHPNG
jgi:hypothetical protein